MGPNRRAQGRERAPAEAAAKAERAEAERKAVAEAQKIVAIGNARQAGGRQSALWFYPATRYHQQVTNAREFFVPRRAS